MKLQIMERMGSVLLHKELYKETNEIQLIVFRGRWAEERRIYYVGSTEHKAGRKTA